jgi:peptide-methionine (S)-S-oxide reductase
MKIKTLLTSAIGAVLLSTTLPTYAKTQSIIVAGGCFWCVESDFEKVPGVLGAVSGYINGTNANPTYEQVSTKKTGHYEVVKISYDDEKVTAKELTDYFWKTIDPTDSKGQFCDKGSPYLTGLFYQNEEQKKIFEQSLADIKAAPKNFTAPIVTPVLAAEVFYEAEGYHQDYYSRNPIRYNYYRHGCGRDKRIKQLWGEIASKQYKK